MITSSKGLAEAMMVSGSFIEVMNLCKIKVFSGAVPANAEAAETGELLLTISNASGATGLTWETTATDRSASKKSSETWSGVVASGASSYLASYFRIVVPAANGALPADTGGAVADQLRVQGLVGNTASADLFFTNPTLVSGETKTLAAFSVQLPTL